MFDKTYKTNIMVAEIAVSDLLKPAYYKAKEVRTACSLCPYHGKSWSCPPSSPVASDLLFGKESGFLVAVQVLYEPYLVEASRKLSVEQRDILREATYGKVKQILNSTCRELEAEFDGGVSVSAGVCKNCDICAKLDGLPCRFPQRMRYSFSGLGIDIVKLVGDTFGLDILWSKNSFPDYEVLVSGIFY